LLRSSFLINIFVSAVLAAALLLTYLYTIVHPAYSDLLIENAEDEAVRFASFLVASQNLDKPITRINLPQEIKVEVGRLFGDELLIKLRIFSPQGEIVYSTVPEEIGTLNKHPYFHEKVARGNIYSKTVKKDSLSAEMQIVPSDLVETYVPIMAEDRFLGAIETYYDITSSNQELAALTQHSLSLLGTLALILLSLLYYALHHADLSIRGRKEAEESLKRANEELELRVTERAGELLKVNTNLTREIAERTLSQMALSEALAEMHGDKEKIAGILRSVNDGLLVIDSENKIVMMNRPAENILAVRQTEMIGTPLSQAIKDTNLCNILTSLISSQTIPTLDFNSPDTASGQNNIYQARTSQLRNEAGSVHGTVILMQKVTQERQLEQMKVDFLAMAAHELSTPLATIIGYADLLAGEDKPEISADLQKESLMYIHDKANALSRIVDDLLDISRAESGLDLSINKVSFDLNQMMKSTVRHYSETNTSHSIVLKQTIPNGEILADPTRMGQVLDNLIINAIKYTPNGGHIHISDWRDDNFHHFEIQDDGVGMTPDQILHIFDKFYRADVSNTAKPGIGLGMSITKHIIEGHGGSISVTSEPGRGTEIRFSLPRCIPERI